MDLFGNTPNPESSLPHTQQSAWVMQGRAGGLVLRGLKKKPFSHQSFELFEQLSSSLEQKPAGRLCPQSRETYTGDRGVLNYDD